MVASFLQSPIDTMKSFWQAHFGPNGESASPDGQPEVGQPPLTTQLHFSDEEKRALISHIESCEEGSRADHQRLKERWADQQRKWRDPVGLAGGEQGKSNYRVDLIKAVILAKYARETDALFGTNPSIEGVPTGPTDHKFSERVSLAMKWQVYENMRALKPLALWALRRLMHGRSFAWVTWRKQFYNKTELAPDGSRVTKRVLFREGPHVDPLDADDLIMPAAVDGKYPFDSAQTASWLIRRYNDTPTNMLLCNSEPGEETNDNGDYYQGIRALWSKLINYSRYGVNRDTERDMTGRERDYAEGVDRDYNSNVKTEQIEIWEFHGEWRKWAEENDERRMMNDEFVGGEEDAQMSSVQQGMGTTDDGSSRASGPGIVGGTDSGRSQDISAQLSEGQEYLAAGAEAADLADAGSSQGRSFDDGTFVDTDGRRKEMVASNVIIRYCPRLKEIVGIQDADEIYPDTPVKRPVFELSFMNDGQYYCQSLMELVESEEEELTVLANKAIEAIAMQIAPPGFYNPAGGEAMVTQKYESNTLYPTTDPGAINFLDVKANLSSFPVLWNMFTTLQEMKSGVTQQVMGRGMEQPNAPRTLGGQRLVNASSDVRIAHDMRMLGEDLKPFVDYIWDLWRMNGTESDFYRVAEGESQGQFQEGEIANGFAKLGAKEREGNYDFTLKFADDAQVKEGKKQEMLALLQILTSLPRVQQDMQYQDRLIQTVCEMFGVDASQFGQEPPAPMWPMMPDEIWTRLLEGEELHPRQGEDNKAIIEYLWGKVRSMHEGPPDSQDQDAMMKAMTLIQEHEEAFVAAQQAQIVAQAVGGMLQAAGVIPPEAAGMGGVGMMPGQSMPGAMPPQEGGVIGG